MGFRFLIDLFVQNVDLQKVLQ